MPFPFSQFTLFWLSLSSTALPCAFSALGSNPSQRKKSGLFFFFVIVPADF